MIKIFNSDDRDFSTAGNIIINPTKCIETRKKSLNGWYLDIEVPIQYKDFIEQDMLCVVKTKSKLNPQAFRIKNIEKKQRKIVFQARHVMFDAEDYFLLDVRPTDKNGQNALSYINERTDKTSPFNVFSNVTVQDTAYFIRKNMLEAWTIIEERWGGVFDADNWDIRFLTKVGNDNGETVMYGKNLQGIEVYEDWSSVVTKLYPVGYDGLLLPEIYLESNIQYTEPYTRTVDFTTDLEMEEQTTEKMITELRIKARSYLEENKVPKISYTVSVNVNESLEMGDTVHIKHPLCNILAEVLEYEYNLISEKTKTITVGNYSRDVKTKFNTIKENINKVAERVTTQERVIEAQTNLINSMNKNGLVYIDENEILILDKLPREEAKNVWRFGLGGLGFSSNGYEGPFEAAITMDGQINANFITVGQMNVARIEGLTDNLNEIHTAIEFNSTNIQTIVNRQNDVEKDIAQMIVDINKISSEVGSEKNLTLTTTGKGIVVLAGCYDWDIISLRIKGNNTVFDSLYFDENIYFNDDLTFFGDSIIVVRDEEGNETEIDLGIDKVLRVDENDNSIFDEFYLENGVGKVIRRVEVEEEVVEDLGNIKIRLKRGTNAIYIKNYDAEITAKYVIQNDLTDCFATKIELASSVTQTKEEVLATVSESYTTIDKRVTKAEGSLSVQAKAIEAKLDSEDFTRAAIIGLINNLDGTSTAKIIATFLDLNGIVTANENFKINLDGSMETIAGKIAGINLNSAGLYYSGNDSGDGFGLWSNGTHASKTPAGRDSFIIFHAGGNSDNIGEAMVRIYQNGDCYIEGLFGKSGVTYEYMGYVKTVLAVGDKSQNAVDYMQVKDASFQVVTASGLTCYIAIQSYSDTRLKKNIEDTQISGLDVINKIRHIKFNWKEDGRFEELGYSANQLKDEVNEKFVTSVEQAPRRQIRKFASN